MQRAILGPRLLSSKTEGFQSVLRHNIATLQAAVTGLSENAVPVMKMLVRFHVLGVREGVTRSLESAIMAPSLKTARSTISRVGKYLQTCKQVESGAVSRLSQERSANLDPMTLQVDSICAIP